MSPAGIRRVDCHVHYQPTGFQQRPSDRDGGAPRQRPPHMLGSPDSDRRPGWRDLGQLKQVMDDTGVDLGLILSFPHFATPFRQPDEPTHAVVGRHNRALSQDLEARGEGRFIGTATIDPLDGPNSIAQLERDLQLPHIGGIALLTNYGDVTLDDPRFHPIYELARAFNVPCTVHPGSAWPSWRDAARLGESSFLNAGLGYYLTDALAIMLMAHAGTFDRFPGVRFMFCQLGGAAAICCGRWHFHATQAREQAAALGQPLPTWARTELSDVLARVWLDTHTQDRHALRLVMDEVGSHTIVLGSDYPVTAPDLGMRYVQGELDALGLSPDVRRKIERDNALALLGHGGEERTP